METRPWKGVLIEEVSNHQEPSRWRVWGKFSNLRGQPNWEEKLNKAQDYVPKSNSQQKSTPDARTRHQQVGAKWRGAGGIA